MSNYKKTLFVIAIVLMLVNIYLFAIGRFDIHKPNDYLGILGASVTMIILYNFGVKKDNG